MASIEDLYHNCTILADAKEKAGQVSYRLQFQLNETNGQQNHA